jgi:ABC-2 type transport system ATP-binding protein
MQEVRQQGTTIFYVSHATASVRSMCDRVLILESGHLNYDSGTIEGGSVEGGIRYLQYDEAPAQPGRKQGGDLDEELGADV